MNEPPEYIDRRTLLAEVWRTSPSNLYRKMDQRVDPFPRGQMIGGKRYWRRPVAIDWLERQGADQAPPAPADDLAVDTVASLAEAPA